jgi:RNA polymerase sigma factor (sigma-70 family)
MTPPAGSNRHPRPGAGARFLSDERLARRAAKGDERTFAEIYRRYGQDLYRFCLSIVANPEDGRDALQNTMVKALQALPGEKRSIKLKPWLYRVAHNESVELLRRRRETVRVDPELVAPGAGPAETAARRERLRQLLGDLGALPERQRSMLVMRELSGLEFDQIGEAFSTSPAVVRQTIYEARLSLRRLEEGREMSCEKVMRQLSDGDGRVRGRRDVQAHLRACPDCRAFGRSIEERQHDLAALTPLPAIASAGILHAVLGGGQGAAGGAAAGTTVAAGAGKAAAGSVFAKSVATVAVAATVGVSAADRGGLVDVGLPGGGGGPASPRAAPPGSGETLRSIVPGAGDPEGSEPRRGQAPAMGTGRGEEAETGTASPSVPSAGAMAPGSPSQASNRGRGIAAEHRAQPGSRSQKGHRSGPSRAAPKTRGHGRGASHAKGGAGQPPEPPASVGKDQSHAKPGGEKPQEPSPPAEEPATDGAAEGSSASIGNKSSTAGIP